MHDSSDERQNEREQRERRTRPHYLAAVCVVRDLDGRVEPQPRDRARGVAVGVAPEQVAARDPQRALVRRDPRRLLPRDAPAVRRRERAEPVATMTARVCWKEQRSEPHDV